MAIGSRLTQPASAREHGPHQRFGGRMTASPRRNHYGVIYADPPWTFATYSRKGKGRSAEAYYDCELHRVNASSIAQRSFRSAALEGTAGGRACAGLARLQAEPLGLPLPDISGQENRGGSTGQTSKSTGAKTQCPGGELRGAAELIER